ncbi:hypothetical protein NHQ30_000289 [Ciborinia camelliae]|nr:hypothetical protein NHQ30_000289 [Ciborinia camelliae]
MAALHKNLLPNFQLHPAQKEGAEVKCDEQKPVCGVSRCSTWNRALYRITDGSIAMPSSRQSLVQNETPKVLRRMKEVSSIGSGVWDRTSKRTILPFRSITLTFSAPYALASAQRNQRNEDVISLPFAELVSDEQREQKASYHKPGKFNVISNPKSFRLLPQYRRRDLVSENCDAQGSSSVEQCQSIGPDNIILHKFEEFSDNQGHSDHTHSRTVSSQSAISTSGQSASLMNRERNDAHLVEHYRNVLAKQISWLADQQPGPDIFESYAEGYLPVSEQEPPI